MGLTLKEKRIQIKKLSENLKDGIFDFYKSMTSNTDYYIKDKESFEHFDITNEAHYSVLIDYLKNYQKEPDVYTFDEILSNLESFGYGIEKTDIPDLKAYIKQYDKPYKKES